MKDTGLPQQDAGHDFAVARRRRALSKIASRLRFEPDDVSVVRALGDTHIEAHVKEVRTEIGAGRELQLRDLPLKRHERVFRERVPLPSGLRDRIRLSDEWRYAQLAMLVEAWGLRASHARERLLSRTEIAETWFREEYEPVLEVLTEVHIGGEGTDTERYLRIAMLRYLLLQTHD